MNSTVGDIMSYAPGREAMRAILKKSDFLPDGTSLENWLAGADGLSDETPLRGVVMFTKGAFSEEDTLAMLEKLNG